MPNRRSFLGSLAALIVAPFVPMPAVKPNRRQPVSMVRLAQDIQRRYNIAAIEEWQSWDEYRRDMVYLSGDQWSTEDRQARA